MHVTKASCREVITDLGKVLVILPLLLSLCVMSPIFSLTVLDQFCEFIHLTGRFMVMAVILFVIANFIYLRRSIYNILKHYRQWSKFRSFWYFVRDFLYSYIDNLSPGSSYFHHREGMYVFLRFFLSIDILLYTPLYCSISPLNGIFKVTFIIGILYIILDIVFTHTAIVFVTSQPADTLRSLVLVLLSLLTVVVSFAVLYILDQGDFKDYQQLTKFSMVYFSFVTITTLGYGDISPCPQATIAQLLIMAEGIIGLYFIVVVFATIVNWMNTVSPRRPV